MDEIFAYLVLAIVDEIPIGMVTTYGVLADLAGFPNNSRLVAKVLSQSYIYGQFPCHRVVNHKGRCAPNWEEQRSLLEDEGVAFTNQGNVDMKKHLWTGD